MLLPVSYLGRTFIRIGPCRNIATEAEERILAERRTSYMATFDTMPCLAARLSGIDTDLCRTKYLQPLLGKEMVETDSRPIEEQMAAVGMHDLEHQCPTYAAMVLFGKHPRRYYFTAFKVEVKLVSQKASYHKTTAHWCQPSVRHSSPFVSKSEFQPTFVNRPLQYLGREGSK